MASASQDLDRMLKAMTLKDLRIQLRARGLSPAGGNDQLSERLKGNMVETNDFALKNESGGDVATATVTAGVTAEQISGQSNNYSRPGGQNTGNYMTERNTSRVLAPPGGTTSIVFGDDSVVPKAAPAPAAATPAPAADAANESAAPVTDAAAPAAENIISGGASAGANNNYSRPGGQNTGNFLTEKNTSRVLAPPGGHSQIVFGDDSAAAADKSKDNNYSRPGGQNTGNFLTEKNTSRVLAPPGGASQICFGEDNVPAANSNNNYSRPGGQNTGNFMTEKNTSRVLAPPGGASQITFGDEAPAASNNNNYSRPGGQNTGNFMTDRNTSRVLAPPGGASQITFGDEAPAVSNNNNYSRPGGQNTGNFMTSRNTSRVLAPPGGASQIVFGDGGASEAPKASSPAANSAPAENIINSGISSGTNNNYSRPGGQNCGNFLTERNTSRVLAPPGGKSQITFGDGSAAPEPVHKAAPAPPRAEAAGFVPHNVDKDDVVVEMVVSMGGVQQDGGKGNNNNYSRPGGQNTGNFLTERNTSRVLAPPGGTSQIIFG